MKRFNPIALSTAIALAAIVFSIENPFSNLTRSFSVPSASAQSTVQSEQQAAAQMELLLSLSKQAVQTNDSGEPEVVWERLEGDRITVAPGNVLRYQIATSNVGERPTANFVLTQPIPAETIYVLDSAATLDGAEPSFSIDGGESFVSNPTIVVELEDGTVEEQPAPAELYTHVRWSFAREIAPAEVTETSYQVRVRDR
ncbi:hypothetical protein [Synechococcus sp. PCC 7336]|uniref:hypothetical protein n=1 Tax=Synechococcus sp. PCC 7336 TaxID=195250 RepID=UPI00034B5E83|nr:hypothetical protein [Synechococcus sp. PCC 7336]